jgi:hypothetical protein
VSRVELTIEPEASYARTARQVAVAVARRAGVPDDTLEEVRLAVGEATGLLLRLDPVGAAPLRLAFDDAGAFAVDLRSEVSLGAALGPREVANVLRSAAEESSDGGKAPPLPVEAILAVLDQLTGSVDVRTGPDGVRMCLTWAT